MRELDGSAQEPIAGIERPAAGASAAPLHADAPPVWAGQVHEAQEPEEFTGLRTFLKRVVIVLSVLVVLAMLVALPPLVNVNRYQRRIATSIGASLGRPVHFDSVTLNVLPMPGFTISRFVVSEDPAFGYEPVIRADSVQATLRMSSLWRRRVEFSKISLTDPSVNLVHLPDGRWNVESILLQASRMAVAPTVQKQPGETQRFPYIEATGARLNLKIGAAKSAFALTDAEFALWLPETDQWHLRLEAHPTRTDTSVSDSGTLRVEGTLGRAAALDDVPVDLSGEWRAVPMGAVSQIALATDAGLRGEMTTSASVKGTVGQHTATTRLQLTGVRRADFVPAQTLNVDLTCSAMVTEVYRVLNTVRCTWPAGDSGGLTLTGAVPNTEKPASATGKVTVKDVPASALLDGIRVASQRIPKEVALAGTVSGTVTRADGTNTGTFLVKDARLTWEKKPFVTQDVTGTISGTRVALDPVKLDLGGREPALLSAAADDAGLEVALRGTVFAGLMKGLGLAAPANGVMPADMKMRRGWGAEQPWVTVAAAPASKAKGKKRRR